jgi:hypothetical protein
MAQIKKPLQEVRIPFSKMSFTPDVPSTALGPTEYNDGRNVETDVRGIRSMAGDEQILDSLPNGSGPPTFVTGGFRLDGEFWFIVATAAVDATPGQWFACSADTTWYDITPTNIDFDSRFYDQATNITEAWSGNTLIVNDEHNPPMFFPDAVNAIMVMYSNQLPIGIDDITPISVTEKQVYFSTTQSTIPFNVGDYVTLTDVSPRSYNDSFEVTACAVDSVTIFAPDVTDAYSNGGEVSPEFSWNFEPNFVRVYAKFCRSYNSPNLGELLVAGNLVKIPGTVISVDSTTSGDPDILTTYASTADIGNEIIGPNIPPFTTIIAAVDGVSLTLDNAPTTTDTGLTYTIVDILNPQLNPVSIRWSQAFADYPNLPVPGSWSPTLTGVADEFEAPLRGPAVDAFPSNGQLFISSYWDTVVASPLNYSTTAVPQLGVRPFNQGRGMLSSNCWANTDKLVYGIDARDVWVFDGQNFNGLGNQRVKNWFFNQVDPENYDRIYMDVNTQRNQVEIYYPDFDAVDGVPNKMLSYRYDLDCWNAPRDVSSATFSCESPIYSYDAGTMTWSALLSSRTVVYAQGLAESQLIQKDQGYSFIPTEEYPQGQPINSLFRRDNIKLAQDYSTKIMVHRLLPEVVNLGAIANDNNEIPIYPSPGEITVTIEGANSVGSIAGTNGGSIVSVAIYVDANGSDNEHSPWAQINQNAFRVNSLSLSDSSAENIWMCNATTWQVTEVEDDR